VKKWSFNLPLNRSFWKQDGFVGALVALMFLFSANSQFMQNLEHKFYDLGVRLSSHLPSDKIAVITIDENSIANLGHWPWSRSIHARMIEVLNSGHPKLIAYTTLFSEPQVDEGLNYIYRIAEYIGTPSFRNVVNTEHIAELAQLNNLLRDATQNLDYDQKLSDSMVQSNNVLLGMFFDWGEVQGKLGQPLADYVTRNGLPNMQNIDPASKLPLSTKSVSPPIPTLGGAATAIGNINLFPDVDGKVRRESLVVRYYDQYYPSLSLILAAKSLNLDIKDIQVKLGEGVQLGNQFIATDANLRMHTHFYKPHDGVPAFQEDSFYDVYTGKIPPEKYRDKIVLIGTSASNLGINISSPIAQNMPPVISLAHSLSSILKGDYFVAPSWGIWLESVIFLAIVVYLIVGLPRLSSSTSVTTTATVAVGLLMMHFILMTTQAIWLQLILPTTLLLTGHLLLATKRFFIPNSGAQKSDADSIENNRALGLAFQGQGQLEMAFDKLRKIPLDDNLMEVLYNLGLDFERKRQFNKAESVFKYIAKHDSHFRDLSMRLSQSHTMWDTLVMGRNGRRTNNDTNMLSLDSATKPMLGRYEIEKELGKGTMGVVYRGRDTKIGRVVAIKTMTFSRDFEEDELQEITMRFFREAETAGRLSHPNIVAIYDVGEERELSYIAMEFLNGDNLEQYTHADNLLPLETVVDLIAQVADALDYAHRQNVVHRDIKPANIMYDVATGIPKVTDFGIARITNSSQTKTGMVFGTPSYMSPEQLAGKKIQGGSDLFSLGTTLYQLACGKLPFEGESMAQLMYAIANQPHVDILTVRSDVPECLSHIINKTLSKKPDDRYTSGAQMAAALRLCASSTWTKNK
jgi:serine/threonine-protein kinase